MQKTLSEIAGLVDGKVVGDGSIIITGLNGLQEAVAGDLSFVANPKYIPLAGKTKASALIVSSDFSPAGKPVIQTKNPSWAFAQVFSKLMNEDLYQLKGIHPTAVIADDAVLGEDVVIGPYVVIGPKVEIADGATIQSGCSIGHNTTIGPNSFIYSNVSVRERVVIGSNVVIHNGSVIGSDGFGFENIQGQHQKIPQIGTVVIEDNVEIGANVTIDRARFDKTVIGKGTKIDNLVQIAHNVEIGDNCIIVAQVGISGSVKVGNGAILAGQVGIAGHITIGEGAIVAAKAGVTKSVKPNTKVSGYPAKPHEDAKKINAYFQRLPHYIAKIKELEKRISELEKKNS